MAAISPEEMLRKVERYVSDQLGQLPVKRIPKGTNFCYTIGEPPKYFLKLESYRAKDQVDVLEMYRKAGIPVPEIVRLDENRPEFDKTPIIVMKYVPHDPTERITDYDLGSLLKRLHQIQIPGVGKIKDGRGEGRSWEEFLRNYTTQWAKEYQFLEIDPSHKLNEIRNLPKMNSLLHGDLNTDNVLMLNGKLAAVIDPQGLVGDPMFDIAKTLYNPEDQHRLSEIERGYSQKGLSMDEKRRLDLYQQLVRLQKIGWLTRQLTSSNLEDTRRVSYEKRRKSYLESLAA